MSTDSALRQEPWLALNHLVEGIWNNTKRNRRAILFDAISARAESDYCWIRLQVTLCHIKLVKYIVTP